MTLQLNEQEQQLLKNVLHALYKTFRREPGMNIGSCQCSNVYPDDLKTLIDLHDRLADGTKQPEKVWVFTAEQAWDGETAEIIVRTFRTREKAREFMHKFIHEDGDESIEDYVKRKDWYVEIDEPDLYLACDDGCYSTDHIECTVTECEVN